MKGYGDSGKGNQFTSAKKGARQDAPLPSAHDNPPGRPPHKTWAGYPMTSDSYDASAHNKTWEPVRERQRDGGQTGKAVNVASTYGRGANDGSKPSPRKKAW